MDEKEHYDKMLQMTALGLFADSRCRSLHGYLAAHDMEFLKPALHRLINSSERLKYIFLFKLWLDPQLTVKARRIICQHFSPEDIDLLRERQKSRLTGVQQLASTLYADLVKCLDEAKK